MLAQHSESVLPADVRPRDDIKRPDRLGAIVIPSDKKFAPQGRDRRTKQSFQVQRPGKADKHPVRFLVSHAADEFGCQGGLAGAADPEDYNPGPIGTGQLGRPVPLLEPAADEIPILAVREPRDPRPRWLPCRLRS